MFGDGRVHGTSVPIVFPIGECQQDRSQAPRTKAANMVSSASD